MRRGEDHDRTDLFPRDPTGLPSVERTTLHRLRDGDRLALEIAPVVKNIGGSNIRMIAYNGSISGPTLHVDQGSEIIVDVTNNGDVETTVHWHGLRLDNRFDGVPIDTQAPIEIGGVFSYRIKFPDPGFYWYHPHLREDYGQEMGMYGTIIVEPTDSSYWPRVDRQLSITLDDLLIEDGMIAPFSRSGPTFTAMGRFGNVLLVNGEEQLEAASRSARSSGSTSSTRPTPDLQHRAPGRSDEAGRRRQRSLPARDLRRGGPARSFRSAQSSTSSSTEPASPRWSIGHRTGSTTSARSTWCPPTEPSRHFGWTPG